MLIETMSQSFRLARSVDQTSTSYVSKVPTTTEPTGDAATATGASVIDLCPGHGILAQNKALIVPFGTGTDAQTFSIRVIGWRRLALADGQCSRSLDSGESARSAMRLDTNSPGVAGTAIDASHYFCDTITVTKGSTLSGELASENIISPANDTIACVTVDLKGFSKLELTFTTGSSASAANAVLALL